MSKIKFNILNKKERVKNINIKNKKIRDFKNESNVKFLEFTNNVEGLYFSKKEIRKLKNKNRTLVDLKKEIVNIVFKYKEK